LEFNVHDLVWKVKTDKLADIFDWILWLEAKYKTRKF